MTVKERAQGCLVGLLCGDSLGGQVEFMGRTVLQKKYPHGVTDMVAGGTWDKLAGQITDDGEMAITLARVLVEHGPDMAEIQKAYVQWAMSHPFDMGATTSRGLKGNPNYESKANGALMRVAPLGIYGAGMGDCELYDLAFEEASITHINPVCGEVSGLYTVLLAWIVSDRVKYIDAHQELCNLAVRKGVSYETLNALKEIREPEFSWGSMGYVMVPFQAALFHYFNGSSFCDAVIQTIAMGGDTDTNAAIVGALMGAHWGIQDIPVRWIHTVCNCRPGGSLPRPKEYWGVDAMDLAEVLSHGTIGDEG